MIVILDTKAEPAQVEELCASLRAQGIEAALYRRERQILLELLGDTSRLDTERLRSLAFVEEVCGPEEPCSLVSRRAQAEDTVIALSNGAKIGGGSFLMMAGPCSVESEEQLLTVAQAVKAAGAQVLRGGAFKPRSSPYTFQGLREEGIRLLLRAKEETGLPIVTEIMDAADLPLFTDVDIIQVGARNMQNFALLRRLGELRKPILLKRGMGSTLQELLMSAEYILAGGNRQVILCERGIRTFEASARCTMDIGAIPLLHRMTHLPVIADPSHATGQSALVPPMALAAVAAGADGLLIEVHNDPAHALCDGPQSLRPQVFSSLADSVRAMLPLADRSYSAELQRL